MEVFIFEVIRRFDDKILYRQTIEAKTKFDAWVEGVKHYANIIKEDPYNIALSYQYIVRTF